MKLRWTTTVLFSLLMLYVSSANGVSEDELFTSISYTSEYQGKKYVASIPQSILKASPDFDYASTVLPKSLKDIAAVAKTQLDKITIKDQRWELRDISFNRWYPEKNKWYYAVGFQSSSNDFVTILVTVDGRLGVLKEIQEKTID